MVKHIINLSGVRDRGKSSILELLKEFVKAGKEGECSGTNWTAIGNYNSHKIGIISVEHNDVEYVSSALNKLLNEEDVKIIVCESGNIECKGSVYRHLWETYKKDDYNLIEMLPIFSYGDYGKCFSLDYDEHQDFMKKLDEVSAQNITSLIGLLITIDW